MMLITLGLIVVVALVVLAMLVYQGRRTPGGDPQYVALGSSYAAGLGLGARAPGSPFACQRSVNGYPQRLATATGLSLVDMTCSAATLRHVLHGGQWFQGPQLAAVGPTTQLVTLTAGGNDVSYVGDLVGAAYQNRGGVTGRLAGLLSSAPKPAKARDFAAVEADIRAIVEEVRRRAPGARIVIATYPPVLPQQGACPTLALSEAQVTFMRPVAAALAEATRSAARATGAMLVDMAAIGIGHDACSATPWINGVSPATGAPFHPTQAGADATAQEIARIIQPG